MVVMPATVVMSKEQGVLTASTFNVYEFVSKMRKEAGCAVADMSANVFTLESTGLVVQKKQIQARKFFR